MQNSKTKNKQNFNAEYWINEKINFCTILTKKTQYYKDIICQIFI